MSGRLPEQESDNAPRSAAPAQASGKPPWWLWGSSGLLLGIGFMLLVGSGSWRSKAGTELQHLGTVPAFTLLERSGRSIEDTALRGTVWVANFMYTRCVTECPLLSNALAQLQGMVMGDTAVQLVSITVDPEHDTPEVLSRYAQSFAAHPQRWWFLTGDKAAIYRLALEGFHLGVGDPKELRQSSTRATVQQFAGGLGTWLGPAEALAHHGSHPTAQGTVLHSTRFVLVDRQGQIRNYYDGMDPESVRRVYRDIRRLLQER